MRIPSGVIRAVGMGYAITFFGLVAPLILVGVLPPLLTVLIAVAVSLALTLLHVAAFRADVRRERSRRWTAPTFGREDAHALGLPWIGADGVVEHPPAPRPTAEQVHAGLHARRLAAQPEVVHVPGVGWTFRHPL